MATHSNDIQRLSSLMKFHAPRMVLLSLFAFAAMGSASATPTKTPPAVFATEPGAVQTTAANPWQGWPVNRQHPCLPVTTTTGMTTAGKLAETIAAEKTGVAINGVGSKPAAKPSAAVMTGPCTSVTTTITATIVAEKNGCRESSPCTFFSSRSTPPVAARR